MIFRVAKNYKLLKNINMRRYIKDTEDSLGDKSFNFAVRIVYLARQLQEQKKEYVLSRQLMRSGTNPMAMVKEAKNTESGKDFIHKLSIGQKEIGETQLWLELLYATEYIDEKMYKSMSADAIEIIKILTASIKTKKKNLGNNG